MKIAIYSTIFGGYDSPKPFPQQNSQHDITYYLISDKPMFYDSKVRKNVVIKSDFIEEISDKSFESFCPRMKAKVYKCMPFALKEMADADYWIFFDGAIHVTSPEYVEYCLSVVKNSEAAFYKHAWLKTIFDDVKESRLHKKYNQFDLESQAKEYTKQFSLETMGLYWGGMHIRKNTEKMKKMMIEWWLENIKWSYQDQISLPYIFAKNKFKPEIFKDNYLKNEKFSYGQHIINDYGQA